MPVQPSFFRAPRRWALALLLGAAAGLAPAAPLRVCMTDVPHAPWRLPDADGRVREAGLDFRLLREFERLGGWQVEVQLRPGKRCLLDLQHGMSDATVGLSHNSERADLFVYPLRQGQPDARLALRFDSYSLYRLPRTELHWDGLQLVLPKGGAILSQPGHTSSLFLRERGVAVDERLRSAEALLRAVLAGEAALAALHTTEAESLRAQHPELAGLVQVQPRLIQKPYFVVFSKAFAQRHPNQLGALWQQFQRAAQFPDYQRAAQEGAGQGAP
ncbi:MAG: hypothetical protein U1E77_04005 [Inhella sp.]